MTTEIQLLLSFLLLPACLLLAQPAEKTTAQNYRNPEQLLQQALRLRQQEQYVAAAALCDTILSITPDNNGIRLLQGGLLLQGSQYAAAVKVYQQLIPTKFQVTIARINLSYALFMDHHPAKALFYARQAWAEDKNNVGAVINHFNAMLWNMLTAKARHFLADQEGKLNKEQRILLHARLEMSSGAYKKGIRFYDSLMHITASKYDRKEFAEVLFGKSAYAAANRIIRDTANGFAPSDHQLFANKIREARKRGLTAEVSYFKDIANNQRWDYTLAAQTGSYHRYRTSVQVGRSVLTSSAKQVTNTHFGRFTVAEKWSKSLSGVTSALVQQVQSGSGNFAALTASQAVQYQPNDRRMFGLTYNTKLLDFTADILNQKLRTHEVGYVTHLMYSGKDGFFSQGSLAFMSDGNKRYQFFGSLYHLFRTNPIIKAGVNASALHFSDNSVTSYFAPDKYLSTEVFAEFSHEPKLLPGTFINAQGAMGYQRIEDRAWDRSARLQAEGGYRKKAWEAAFKYQTSNVASAVGTGYKYWQYSLRVAYRW